MFDLSTEFEVWLKGLPLELQFINESPETMDANKVDLALLYHSAKASLYQLCLCADDAELFTDAQILEGAQMCIRSTQAILQFFPPQPEIAKLISRAPWWTILPHLYNSAAVLLLTYEQNLLSIPSDLDLASELQKILLWMRALSSFSLSAKRAQYITVVVLTALVERKQRDDVRFGSGFTFSGEQRQVTLRLRTFLYSNGFTDEKEAYSREMKVAPAGLETSVALGSRAFNEAMYPDASVFRRPPL